MNKEKRRNFCDLFDAVETEDTAEICSEYTELTAIDNRYERKELIGEGGMKKVWCVYDRHTRATLAYAEPREGLHPAYYDSMLEEAWRTASLSHPNIIKIHDTGTDGFPFFTMDLKYGDTLKEWKMRRNPSLDDCLDVFLKVCDAMVHAHSRSVLHLDLKPDNIQIEGMNEVVVCDWGSSDGEGATPGYMAPEQRDIKNPKDQRTDIYGLGAVLYFLLTGESSVKGETAQKVIANTTIGIELPRYRFPELCVPRALNQIVARAMAVEPKQRYGSVKELCDDIIRFRNQRPTSSQESNPFTCSLLFYIRNQFSCNLAVISCLALILGGGWGIRKIEQYNNERQADKTRAEQAEQMVRTTAGELQQAEASIDKLLLDNDAGREVFEKQMAKSMYVINHMLFYRQPLEAVKILQNMAHYTLESDPESPAAWDQLATLHFLNFDFPKVHEIVRTHKPYRKPVWRLYSRLPDKSYTYKKNKPYAEILSNFGDYAPSVQQSLVSKLFAYEVARKQLSYKDAITQYIRRYDPNAGDITLSYDLKELILDVNTTQAVLESLVSIFTCEKITLAGNWPSMVSLFSRSGVRELDISKRSIKDSIESLNRLRVLQSLTVRKGAYTKDELKKIHRRIKVTEVP